MIVKEKIGEGKNNSDLTKDECLRILNDWTISFDCFNETDLDSLYFVATGSWAYHFTKLAYVSALNSFRLNNVIC